MELHNAIYLATVCLERNRWGRRVPSFRVSDWLARVAADGFDGIELWENHFLLAEADEQARLATARAAVPILNSYVGFADAEAAARTRVAEASVTLNASAVKYNLGPEEGRLEEYGRNLHTWAQQLPLSCRLLCECHPGTVLERLEAAVAFLAPLDPARFGVIVHIAGDAAQVEQSFAAFGTRIQHLHLQMRNPETDPTVAANRQPFDACFEVVKRHGFHGSTTIEFTRGIGRNEEIETLYANACVDLAYCRERLA